MNGQHLDLVLETLRDAQRYNVNRALFHEGHANTLANFRDSDPEHRTAEAYADTLEHHLTRAEWHRERAADLSAAASELRKEGNHASA